MGTSKSFVTPSGGAWTAPKRLLTAAIGTGAPFDAEDFVHSAFQALGGVGMNRQAPSGGNGGRGSGVTGGGERARGGRAQGRSASAGGAAFNNAVRGLGAFGAQVGS